MTAYVDPRDSIRSWVGDNPRKAVEVVANRYIGANAPIPFVFRAFSKAGILQTESGMFDMNLNSHLPDARIGQYAYVFGLVWSDSERTLDVLVRCLGPTKVVLNGNLEFRSTVIEEIQSNAETRIEFALRPGWNSVLIEARKSAIGFGCEFGAVEAKVRILNVLAPFSDRRGQAGWVFSEAVDRDLLRDGFSPEVWTTEADSGLTWYPRVRWDADLNDKLPCERIFGLHPGQSALAWTTLKSIAGSADSVTLRAYTAGPIMIWLDGERVAEQHHAGVFTFDVTVTFGEHDLLVQSVCQHDAWGFNLDLDANVSHVSFVPPFEMHGTDGGWVYLGPLSSAFISNPESYQTQCRLFESLEVGASTYWRLDMPDTWIRPYYENAMLSNKWTTSDATNFGRWDYPLGVTMYSLLEVGRALHRNDVVDYVLQHIQACVSMYPYAMWDKEQYGFPALNQQLVLMRMLDNCGSFGSAMLESMRESHDANCLKVADVIADFMSKRLERKPDGAWYRTCVGECSENTLWADDLFMGTPFLCRYARLTQNDDYLDLAAEQFLLFKKYLFMPEQGIMSHVYDFKFDQATGIPWGRGNGWVAFSLSEVLQFLPDSHPRRPDLVQFFEQLCDGIANLQGPDGLWHQVLNDSEAYLEASCTAMFTVAFCRGVRNGWLDDVERYVGAALRGWEGLSRFAIDRRGNVLGVCSGSRYSFTADYYKFDLKTVTNDNHGIGIVMMAGVEIQRLREHLGNYRSGSS